VRVSSPRRSLVYALDGHGGNVTPRRFLGNAPRHKKDADDCAAFTGNVVRQTPYDPGNSLQDPKRCPSRFPAKAGRSQQHHRAYLLRFGGTRLFEATRVHGFAILISPQHVKKG
jgi:hypothetical protein